MDLRATMENRRYTVTYYPRFLTKQASTLSIHDLMLDTYKSFHEEKVLGAGDHGYVRLFTHGHEKIAVKGLSEDGAKSVPVEDSDEIKKAANSELKFLRKANGNSQLCTLKHYIEPANETHPTEHYSYRMTIPFIEGKSLDDFAVEHIKHPDELALLMLRVAQALQQLHDDGVIHGDVGSRNILISADGDDFIVQFIDFGLSYPINGYATSGFLRAPPNASYVLDIAEERYAAGKVRAHPSQDVFTLGKVFETLLMKMTKKIDKEIRLKFPCIMDFIKTAITDTIEDRPTLHSLIVALEPLADWKMKFNPCTRALIHALTLPTYNEAKKLLETKSAELTVANLESLLIALMERHQFNSVIHLLRLKKRLSLEKIKDTLTTALNTVDNEGNTIVHVAAQQGMTSIVFSLLKLNPDLTILNHRKEAAITCAEASIAPVLKLFKFIQRAQTETAEIAKQSFFRSFMRKNRASSLTAAMAIGAAIINNQPGHERDSLLATHKEGIMADKDLQEILRELAEIKLLSAKELNKFGLNVTLFKR